MDEMKSQSEKKSQSKAAMIEELRKAREELWQAQAVLPAMPLLRVDDDTPEAMAMELVKQGGRLLAASPEARTLENITRYDEKPNADVFLKGHAGDDIRSGRVSRGRDEVERAALSCAFSPQPSVLEGLAETPELRSRGFLARWVYALPKSEVGYRQIDPPPPPVPASVREDYHANIKRLWLTTDAEQFGVRKPHALHFSTDAATELTAFLVWVENCLRPGGRLAALCGWGNKLGGLCVRLCAVFHATDGVPFGSAWLSQPIGRDVVKRAVRFCREYAVPHALAAFDLMGASAAVVNARVVLKWLGRRPDPTADFTKRDLFNGCRAQFETVANMDAPLMLLEQHVLIRPKVPDTRPGPGRKPSPTYEVNPDAFKDTTPAQNAHNTQKGRPDGAGLNSAHCAYSASEHPDADDSSASGEQPSNSGDSAYGSLVFWVVIGNGVCG